MIRCDQPQRAFDRPGEAAGDPQHALEVAAAVGPQIEDQAPGPCESRRQLGLDLAAEPDQRNPPPAVRGPAQVVRRGRSGGPANGVAIRVAGRLDSGPAVGLGDQPRGADRILAAGSTQAFGRHVRTMPAGNVQGGQQPLDGEAGPERGSGRRQREKANGSN